MTASATLVTTVFGFFFSLAETWQTPAARDLLLRLFSSAFVLAGQTLITFAVRSGDVSQVMPFRYSGLVWSLLLGALIWNNFPNALALTGMAVIAAAGLFSLQRKDNVNVGQHAMPVLAKVEDPQKSKA